MNRRVNLTLGLVLSALICITSVGGTFASWRVSNDTVNKLSVGVVRGEINETYTDGLTYMPGATVEKIVNFTNTGTVDSVIRVKLTPAWGDTRTSDGKLVVNTALPADSVHINCSSALWLYDGADGYYYYLGVLAPGETTHEAVMNSFTISPTLGNAYAGKQGDIKVELECVQAGGGGIALWGKTLSELGIVYTPDGDTPPDVNVFFDGPESGFSFDVLRAIYLQTSRSLFRAKAVLRLSASKTTARNSPKLHCARISLTTTSPRRTRREPNSSFVSLPSSPSPTVTETPSIPAQSGINQTVLTL